MKKIDIRQLKTYYINLDIESERRIKMESMLKINGFKDYQRIEGVLEGERRGCAKSHVKVLEKALEKNTYPYLVLEDDLEFLNKDFVIEAPDDTDAFYLGLSIVGADFSKPNNVQSLLYIKNVQEKYHQVVNMVGRHAILHMNRKYDIELLKYNQDFLNNTKKFVAGDVSISRLNELKNVYALNNPIFYQTDPKTIDATKVNIDEIKYIVVE